GFDFSPTGLVTVYANMPVPALASGSPGYTFTFDFGNTLPSAITSFTLLDGSLIKGAPGLSVVSGHSIGLDLSGLAWTDDYSYFTAQLGSPSDTGAHVPEPTSLALMLAGAAGLAVRRKRSRSPVQQGD